MSNRKKEDDLIMARENNLGVYYAAHRGFFDNESNWPENSVNAFKRAVENGYGIELDVQLTKDGIPIVFHDCSLKRMCGVDKYVWDVNFDDIRKLKLAGSNEIIPTFEEVLSAVDGNTPLIVEIKGEKDVIKTTKKACKLLDEFYGPVDENGNVDSENNRVSGRFGYCVESFNPLAVWWYKRNRPNVIRGQLSTDYKLDEGKTSPAYYLLTYLAFNIFTRPDFVAYNVRYATRLWFRIYRKLTGAFTVAWTVKSEKEYEKIKKLFDVIIFDTYVPLGKGK
ncbi:MAG: glycerophosphodiester phosphodiesterase family protein [Oscillospiraceae bacterium]|nr:glycerophosphodiester phosphodiesterase family protein [Oscillospiraceae bacterium]